MDHHRLIVQIQDPLPVQMIKKILISLLPFIFILLLTGENLSDDGRAGYTGSPGESDCTNCHSSFPVNTGGGSITLQNPGMPANEYVPGQSYTLSVTVTRSSNNLFGFGFEALNSINDNAGTLVITDPAATQIKTRVVTGITRRNVVHQLNAGSMSGSKTFNFSWTAPASGTGPVNFYFAGVAADGNGNDNNDYVYKSSLTVDEFICSTPPQPSAITGNTVSCTGSSHTYSVGTVSGATSYTWNLPSGWTGASSTNSITVVTGNSSGNISVSANNLCGSSLPSTLLVNSSNMLVTLNKTDVNCHGDSSGSAGILISGVLQPYAFNWTVPGQQNLQNVSNLPAGTYSVTVTDSLGCFLDTSLTIHEPLNNLVADAGLSATLCEGTSINIGGSTSASGGTPNYTYLWSPSSGLNNATLPNPVAGLTSSTIYTLVATDSKGCQSTDTTSIFVLPAAAITLTLLNDTLFSSAPGVHQWFYNTLLLTSDTNSFLIPTQDGNYMCSYIYPNGCVRNSAIFYYDPTDIIILNNNYLLNLFPNPTGTHLNVSLSSGIRNATFAIIDINGRILREGRLDPGKNTLLMNELEAGLFFFHIKHEDGTLIQKFIH